MREEVENRKSLTTSQKKIHQRTTNANQQPPTPMAPKDTSSSSDLSLLDSTLQRSSSSSSPSAGCKKKHVRWSTITIHEFGVGLGASTVSGKGGPSIGLSDEPEFTWTTKVGEMAECSEGVHRFTRDERVRLLQTAGVSEGMILRFSREANIILGSRRRTLMEDLEAKKAAKKRKAESAALLERPCASYLGRPRMIPANYV